MAGLIERSVWVWPSWDRVNQEHDYTAANLSMGWFETQTHGDKAFCMCMSSMAEAVDECRTFTEYGPYGFNGTDEGSTTPFEGFPVPPDRCKIEKTTMVEEISETKAVTLFRKTNWLRDQKNIILDIDEDYFGCTHAIRPLLDVNVTADHINSIDDIVGVIFCPSTLNQEKQSDDILQGISKEIRKFKTCKHKHNTKHTDKCGNTNSTVSAAKRLAQTIQSLRKQNLIRLCSNYTGKLSVLLKRLIYRINKMNAKQIKQLQYVGFCSKTSLKTMVPDDYRHFGVCGGANSPDNSVVIEHQTSVEEVTQRSRLLTILLEELRPMPPKIATVCRSVRDGYTPRNMSDLIEHKLLSILNQTFLTNITYDSGLLGGKVGWSSAHVKMML